MAPEDYKNYLTSLLSDVYNYFNDLLSEFGQVYIAGGACRDSLLGIAPKDYDIFILNERKINKEELEAKIVKKLEDYKGVDYEIKPLTGSEKFACKNLKYGGLDAQIIVSEEKSIKKLLNSFDIDICCVAYGKIDNSVGYIFEGFPDIKRKNSQIKMTIKNLDDPYTAIQRYCYLSHKLGIPALISEIDRVAKKICENQGLIKEEKSDNYRKAAKTKIDSWSTWGS